MLNHFKCWNLLVDGLEVQDSLAIYSSRSEDRVGLQWLGLVHQFVWDQHMWLPYDVHWPDQ